MNVAPGAYVCVRYTTCAYFHLSHHYAVLVFYILPFGIYMHVYLSKVGTFKKMLHTCDPLLYFLTHTYLRLVRCNSTKRQKERRLLILER